MCLELEGQPYTVEKPVPRTTRWHRGTELIETFLGAVFAVKLAKFGLQKSLDRRHDQNNSLPEHKIFAEELSDGGNRMF